MYTGTDVVVRGPLREPGRERAGVWSGAVEGLNLGLLVARSAEGGLQVG